jgi:hypothetical protein
VDLLTSLKITQKGEDEVKRRVYKLSLKKRSVLILLEKPQSIQYILGKSMFPQGEIIEEIRTLITDQFIAVNVDAAPRAAASDPGPGAAAIGPDAIFHLYSGIVISEAKFLLIDFCVDYFGSNSQAFVDQISACSKEQELGLCLAKVLAAAQKQCPDRLPKLLSVVKEINDTA